MINELWPHLEVTLVSVENDRLLSVEFPLHFQGQSTNSWLEVCLFGVHHQPYPILQGMLEHTEEEDLQFMSLKRHLSLMCMANSKHNSILSSLNSFNQVFFVCNKVDLDFCIGSLNLHLLFLALP